MNNKRLFSIILVVFIDLLGFSLILPLLPYYAETFKASQTVTGILIASYALMQLIGAPILGRLSDRFGRRPVLLISVFGTFLGFLLLGFANSLWMLFVSRIIDGLTGGNLSVAQAYISDVTDEKSRSKGLGMVGAAFGLGFIIGPVTGGLLSQWGYAVPAFAAAAVSLINLILIYTWLPESLTEDKRNQMTEKRPPVNLTALLVAFQRPFTGSILITRFFFGLAFAIFQTIFSLYALQKFNLSARDTGFVLTYVGVLSVIVQGFLVGRLTSQYREDILITASVVLMGFSLLGWALAPSVLWVYIIMTPTALSGGLLNTLLSSTLTKAVAPQEIGGILGLSAAVESSTRIIAPILGGALLQQIGTWAPGVFGAAVMVGVSIFVFATIYNHPIAATLNKKQAVPVSVSEYFKKGTPMSDNDTRYELPTTGITLLGYVVRRMHKTQLLTSIPELVAAGKTADALAKVAMYAVTSSTSFGRAHYQPQFNSVGAEVTEADPATGAQVWAKLESSSPTYLISYSATMPNGDVFSGREEITGTTVGLRGLGMPAPSKFYFKSGEYSADLTGVLTSELALSLIGRTRIRAYGFLNFNDNTGNTGKLTIDRSNNIKLEINGKAM